MHGGGSIKGYWPIALAILCLLLALAILSPVLVSGFNGDDIAVSAGYSNTAVRVADSNVLDTYAHLVRGAMDAWLDGGRLFPLSALSGLPLTLADGQPRGYKTYVVVLVLVDIMLFGYLILRVTGSLMIALATLAMLPLTFQVRGGFHDPILGFAGLLPVITALTLVSLLFLVVYLDTGKRRYAVLSALIYGATLLTYEIAIVFCLLHVIIVWLYPVKQPGIPSVRRAVPYLALAASSASAALVVRLLNHVPIFGGSSAYLAKVAQGADGAANAYVLSLSPGLVLATLAKQIVAAVPMSYQLLDTAARARLAGGRDFAVPTVRMLIVLGLAIAITALVWRAWSNRHRTGGHVNTAVAWALAAALVVLPNVLIVLSPRYQTEITWGVGYLPVYITYFGVALLLALLLHQLFRQLSKRNTGPAAYGVIAVVLALSLGYCGFATYTDNWIEVSILNVSTRYPRDLIMSAADKGLFDEVSGETIFSVAVPHYWDNSQFIGALLGRPTVCVPWATRLETVNQSTEGTSAQVDSGTTDTYYWLDYNAFGRGNGYAILGRQIEVNEVERRVTLADVRLYLEAEQSPGLPGGSGPALNDTSPAGLNLDPAAFSMIDGGATWSLYEMTTEETFTAPF